MATQSPIVFTQGNTQDIRLFNVQDVDSGQFWTAAVAAATLYDQNGNATMVQDVSLLYQAGTNGNYIGTVTTDFSMPIGGGYTLQIDASQNGASLHLELPAIVKARTS